MKTTTNSPAPRAIATLLAEHPELAPLRAELIEYANAVAKLAALSVPTEEELAAIGNQPMDPETGQFIIEDEKKDPE